MDFSYYADAQGVSTEQAVVLFAVELAPLLGEVALLGRLAPGPARGPYAIASPQVRVVALPHYRSLTELASVARALRGSCSVFSRELDTLDVVWLFSPSPLSLLFAAIALRRRVPVVFGVRQDTPEYFAHRLPSRRWVWVLPLAHGIDRLQRLLARRVPTTVVGHELARKFGAGRNPVLEMGVSLVRRSDLVSLERARAKSWDGELRLLSVGRLDPEKNPVLLAEVLADLRSRDTRWILDVAGEGPLAEPLRARASELGMADAIRLHGYVPSGPDLQALYLMANALVHVSLTEGLPQVIYEAHAAGLPIVGTDVGGVRAALADGRTGLLAPPSNARAVAAALERLRDDPALRDALIESGLSSVAEHTMEVQLERVAAFIREHASRVAARERPRSRRVRPSPGVNVLMYHDVSAHQGHDPGGWQGPAAARYKIDLARFEQHLDGIAATGAAVGLMSAEGAGPDVALTFDDGGASALRIADALEHRNWRGHFFITTSQIGAPGFVDAETVRALADRGHVVGSHSHTHPTYMGRLPVAELIDEWRRSRDVLGETLGKPPEFASVPGGFHSPMVIRTAAGAGYRVLLTSEPGARPLRLDDLTVLGRYTIRAGTTVQRTVGYATGDPVAQRGARLEWHVKSAAKRLSPRLYRVVTRAPKVGSSSAGS